MVPLYISIGFGDILQNKLLLFWHGILYTADQDQDPDLQKKRTLYEDSLYELKTHF